MAKKARKSAARAQSASRKTGKRGKRSSAKRDLVKTPGAARYTKRTSRGRFKDADDVGRSQARDRRTPARKKVKSGYGDQGDRKGGKKR
jgi:hypothetical protein